MEYQNEEWGISLKDMCVYLLLRWKKIICVAIAAAMLFACAQVASIVTAGQAETTDSPTEKQEIDEEYLEKKIDIYESLVADQHEYMENSILMQLDPLNTYCVKLSLYVSADYQNMPDKNDYTSDVVSYYDRLLNDAQTLAPIADQVGTKVEYLKELVTITSSGNWIEILVLHYDRQALEQIADLFVNYLESAKSRVTENTGEHSVDTIQQAVVKYIGDGIAANQENARNNIATLEKELETLKSELNPVASIDGESMLSSIIKMLVIGFAVGFIGCVFFLCAVFIFSDSIHSEGELECRLGMKVLGKIAKTEKKADPLTKLIRKAANLIQNDTQENYSLIAQRIEYCVDDDDTIAITDYLNNVYSETAANELNKFRQKKIATIGNILNDPVALSSLSNQKNIILVARADTSKYKMLIKELNQLKDAGCNAVGCILVE